MARAIINEKKEEQTNFEDLPKEAQEELSNGKQEGADEVCHIQV